MIEKIDGALFCRMVEHGSACISARKQEINELNVFPVPDGDTGTNMAMTIGTAAEEFSKKSYTHVGQAANAAANALLRGARGNSGVILSLLFRGFAKAMKEKDAIDGRDFAIALDFGVAAAYKAVMKPAEGTILTVSRLSAAAAAAAAREDPAVENVMDAALQEGLAALENTVNQNPVLKKAGVVDSGGKGFLVILQGMLDELRGVPMPTVEGAAAQEKADFAAIGMEDITFTYDTVFIVRKKEPNQDLEALRAYLNSIGDSLVIGESDEEFKVHVHTDIPGEALTKAQEFGTLELAKIENMRTQAEELAAGAYVHSTDDLEKVEAELEGKAPQPLAESVHAAPEKKYGMVAVCAGEGLSAVFRDLGVDQVISGGQTMNPATEDILKAVNATPSEVVFVLPNNKNIILAAQQCVDMVEDKRVVVLQSKTVPQGISALLVLDPEAGVEENMETMEGAMAAVSTAEVTYAARDSNFGGFDIKAGDYMALLNGGLFHTGVKQDELLRKLAADEVFQGAEFINIYYGEDVSKEYAEKTKELFAGTCPNAEVSLLFGGQPVYYYMISAE